jgi:hypothetical protein
LTCRYVRCPEPESLTRFHNTVGVLFSSYGIHSESSVFLHLCQFGPETSRYHVLTKFVFTHSLRGYSSDSHDAAFIAHAVDGSVRIHDVSGYYSGFYNAAITRSFHQIFFTLNCIRIG